MGMKGKPRLKEEENVTKDTAKIEEASASDVEDKRIVIKKWKGKDWFNIIAPENFAGIFLAQTPTTDPKNIMGRTIEVSVSEITGDRHRDNMKMKFVVERIEGKNAHTRFNGFESVREHVMRMVRKRNRKVQIIFDSVTKDGWLLKITALSILNGKTTTEIQKKSRRMMVDIINETTGSVTLNDLIRKIINTQLQMQIKKTVSKIYPVRFFEIEKIKVLRAGESKVTKEKTLPKEENKEARPEEKKAKKTEEKPKISKAKSSSSGSEAKPEKKPVKKTEKAKEKKAKTKKAKK
ncbi:MAG: hypothetical protein JW754_01915 [Candidatus Aenigmarchaeota archaeon]|nr:hypothetical protein [Candidatus Aenigmarchaeota archaeon]